MKYSLKLLTLFALVSLHSPPLHSVDIPISDATSMFSLGVAAQQGNADAQNRLGVLHLDETNTHYDLEKGFYWVEKAARQGYSKAQFNLGVLYEKGKGTEVDLQKALVWCGKAADQGIMDGLSNMLRICSTGACSDETRQQIVGKLHTLAEGGNAEAQFILSQKYKKGEGVEKDGKKEMFWTKKAANQGHPSAQNNLGVVYALAGDFTRAQKWFRRGALNGDKDAQYNLGRMYERGDGVTQDSEQAKHWYSKAADQGHPNARQQLAVLGAHS